MNIIGGPKPTGKLPSIVGSGIFGYKKLSDGIFAGGSFQPSYTPDGIFFEPYSYTSYKKAEPSTGWALERWPGVPLYPGSWAHGLNLVGPSMGGLGANGNQNAGGIPWGWAALGIAGGFLAAMFLARRKATANVSRRSPTGYSVTIKGVGKVIVDPKMGTLRPTTHVVGQRLGVGYTADTTKQMRRQRGHRDVIEASATGEVGMPTSGWEWLDHNGHPAVLS